MDAILFYILAFLAVMGGLLMVSLKNPLSGAFSLILSLCALAGLFAMLHAEFVFILQILVYAGAIMVLIIFTIMLLNLKKEELAEAPVGWMRTLFTAVLCAAAAFGAIQILGHVQPAGVQVAPEFGNMETVGRAMLSDFVYPFEVISLILLVAIVGVVLLAKKVI
ncbi:MAG TPA: NADH-quinone oxidoreductase subunit J [Candidatus Krumholzibacteria bacterium]|nr:NADH-quinone oxidoreductase subunit J [Candidatus Krumholzibacteria bacterium]